MTACVQKQQCIWRLILGGSCHPLLDSQLVEKSLNLGIAHGRRMAFVVKETVLPAPYDVGGFCPQGVMPTTDCVPKLIQ